MGGAFDHFKSKLALHATHPGATIDNRQLLVQWQQRPAAPQRVTGDGCKRYLPELCHVPLVESAPTVPLSGWTLHETLHTEGFCVIARLLLPRLVLFVLALTAAFAPPARAAIDESELLPVEQAFALSTRVLDANTVELRWQIADGYYLYRHRIMILTPEGFSPGELQLPPGKRKHDEFFGDVETYRHELLVRLPITPAAGAAEAAFVVSSQGCADVGICYPPHKVPQRVALPTVATAAASGADSGNPLAALLKPASLVDGDAGLPLPPEQAFGFEAIASAANELLLRFSPAPGHYLYRDRTRMRVEDADDISLGEPRWPVGVNHEDEHFGQQLVYFEPIDVAVPLQRADGAARDIQLKVTFQGCETDGICYPPMTRTVAVSLPAGGAAATDTSAPQAEDSRLAAALSGPDRIWTLLTFFGFGLLLAFTPCVFPMVPILSGIIAGAGNISTRRAFVLSLVYVLATAVVFTIAGVVAGLAGANLQIVFQTPWILVSFALLFVVLSFSMFGFYELQLPSRLQTRLTELSNKQSGGSLFGVAIMGVLSALIVGPCVAPPLAAAVLYISQTRDPILGGLALFSLALGMGAPLLAFGTAAGRILPRAGAWMDAVKAVFGVLFLGLAIWMLDRIVDPAVTLALSGSLLIGSAIYLGALEPVALAASGWKRLWKAIGVLLLLIGSAQMLGALAGGRDLMQPLKGVFGGAAPAAAELHFTTIKSSADLDRAIAAANAAGQPVMFDFYADWCVSCKEMEKYTFTDPAVHQALRGYVLLKADVTANDDIDQELMRRFGIIGPPGTLFFGLDGIEQRHLRLIGFEKAAPFVQRIQKATR